MFPRLIGLAVLLAALTTASLAPARAGATLGAKKMLDMDIPGNTVIGVYRPDFGVRMLEASTAAGIQAPIRCHLTENADGSATLSYQTPSTVFAPYSDGGQPLKDMTAEMDGVFAKFAADTVGS